MRQRPLVAGPLPVEALLVGIAPTGMRPDFGLDSFDLAVERFGIVPEFLVGRRRVGAAGEMVRRFLDLNDGTAGVRQLAQLLVQRRGQVHDEFVVALVVLVPQHHRQTRGADGPEFHGVAGHLLGGLPDRGKMQRAARDVVGHRRRMVGFLHFVQDVAGFDVGIVQKMRRIAVAADAVQPLDRIEKPGSAADFQVEARIPVGEDVQTGLILFVHVAGHRVDVLLAVQRIAHCDLERPAAQALGEPARLGKRADHRRRQHGILRGNEHRVLPFGSVGASYIPLARGCQPIPLDSATHPHLRSRPHDRAVRTVLAQVSVLC